MQSFAYSVRVLPSLVFYLKGEKREVGLKQGVGGKIVLLNPQPHRVYRPFHSQSSSLFPRFDSPFFII